MSVSRGLCAAEKSSRFTCASRASTSGSAHPRADLLLDHVEAGTFEIGGGGHGFLFAVRTNRPF
jgi:hypothetical protein